LVNGEVQVSYVLVVRVLLGCSLGGLGHLTPVVAAAQALGRLGHDPVVLVPPSLSDAATEAGVPFRVGGQPPPSVIDAVWERVRAGPPQAVVGMIDRELFADRCTEAMLDAARDLFDDWRPEMVVREPCEYATAVLAHQEGIAQLQVGISQSAIELGVLEQVTDTIERYGAGVAKAIMAAPYLTSFPASLDPSPWLDTRRFRLPRAAPAPLPDWWPSDRRPLVYVTFGTVLGRLPQSRAVYRTVLDAVADLPARVLMTVGPAVDPTVLSAIPGNTHIERWVPQDDVFREARLVLCHGGSGTTFGALAAGLPVVICPLFADQTANARLVHEAGAGVALPPSDRAAGGVASLGSADVDALRDAIGTLLVQPIYRRRAAQLATEIAATSTLEETLAQLLSENRIS
jgi:UDP:flavonoid glycosyltransferase YjiC (YdhE family)